jgi:ATP-dependent Clp protease protease subunit
LSINRIKTDELDQWHEYGVYTPARLIDLSGEITEDSAVKFIKNIRLLDHVSDKSIKILINTEGGDVHQGLAIIDAIRECQSTVVTHAVGPCWSMGAAILQAGDKRLISQNATVMIHTGKIKLDEDHPEIIKAWQKEIDRIDEIYNDIIFAKIKQKKPRFKKDKLKDLMVFDTIYTAEKAIDMGLADEVAEHKEF